MSDLFSSDADAAQGPVPLAERLRPKTVEEVIGQAQLLAPEAPLQHFPSQHAALTATSWKPTTSMRRPLITQRRWSLKV